MKPSAAPSKKNELKPWQQEMWCIPEASAEYVACMEDVLDLYEQPHDAARPVVYPQAVQVRVVLDNLATHKTAALYETFPPPEARPILKKLESHYTPKHASWLNMAEIELSVFGETMKNYLPQEQVFAQEAQAVAKEHNQANATVDWQFRSPDARIKLKKLYPYQSD